MHDYCVRLGIEGEQMEDMLYLIKEMDEAYLDFRSEQRKKNRDTAKGKKRG